MKIYAFLVGDTGEFLKESYSDALPGQDYDKDGLFPVVDTSLESAERVERLGKIVDNGDGTYRLNWVVRSNQNISGAVICENISYNEWSMFTGTFGEGYHKIYRNGQLCQVITHAGNILPKNGGNDWVISDSTPDKKRGVVGKIDEVYIFNRALSAGEIRQI